MRLISTDTMRALERAAIENGISEIQLMGEAGSGAAQIIAEWSRNTLPEIHRKKFKIVCGRGNNGGDGLKVAQDLINKFNLDCEVFMMAPVEKMSETSQHYSKGLPLNPISEFSITRGDVIIDALLGTGLNGPLKDNFRQIIEIINHSKAPVVSLDCPSGLSGDSGLADPTAVIASLTITFGYPKIGLVIADASKYTGPIRVVPISIPMPDCVGPELTTIQDCAAFLSPLDHCAHKNSRPRVAVIGGSIQYPGAPQLSAIAALRAGAGLVRLLLPENAPVKTPLAIIPCFTDNNFMETEELMYNSDIAVIGPGWSNGNIEVLQKLINGDKTVVIDADALNLIARHPAIIQRSGSAPLIMTPHPGELARLQQAFSLPQVSARIEAAQQMASYCNAIVVLKGARTVIATPDGLSAFNGSGSPALATAGSGDVLAGVIAATAGTQRGQKLFNAICTAVFLHGLAGELHPDAERSVIADDLPLLVAKALKTIMPRA